MRDVRVTALDVTPYRIPLKAPVRYAGGALNDAEHVLVQIRTSAGVTGIAEAIPRPMFYGETTASILHVMQYVIRPALVGRALTERCRILSDLHTLAGNLVAKAAIDIALLDALGRVLEVPCHALLGNYGRTVACTAILGYGSPDEVVERALEYRRRYGINSFKVKVGRGVDLDAAVVANLRTTLGPGPLMYVDANQEYSADDALRLIREIEEYDVAWFEEPCPRLDILGRRRLCSLSPLPIMADESCPTPSDTSREVVDGRATMISIKVARTGIADSTRIRHFCELTGVPALVGSQGESSIGTLVSAAFAASAQSTITKPAELHWFLQLEDEIVLSPLTITDGSLELPDRPGFGADIDENRLRARQFTL